MTNWVSLAERLTEMSKHAAFVFDEEGTVVIKMGLDYREGTIVRVTFEPTLEAES